MIRDYINIGNIRVHGIKVDAKGRCAHWHSEKDIVSFQFPGDKLFYPCYQCFIAIHGKKPSTWSLKRDAQKKVILCGNCQNLIDLQTYIQHANNCIHCHHPFNPGCKRHWHLYVHIA